MRQEVTLVRVFVASPGDVEEERKRVGVAVAELNRNVAVQHDARLEVLVWETHARPDFGADAQDVINAQIPQADIVVIILWNRLGTPTSRAASGTAEEFERAYESWRRYGTPTVMLYFRDSPLLPLEPSAMEQRKSVDEFRERVTKLGAFYRRFSDADDFERKVREHLGLTLSKALERIRNTTPALGSESPKAFAAWRTLCQAFAPAVQRLTRGADDLRLASEYYLVTIPGRARVLERQVMDLDGAVRSYNAIRRRYYQQRVDFEAMIEAFDELGADELRRAISLTLLRADDFADDYPPVGQGLSGAYKVRYKKLAREWVEERNRLASKTSRAREALAALEQHVEEMARLRGEHAPADNHVLTEEVCRLLEQYRQRAVALAGATRALLRVDLSNPKQVLDAAWSELAPAIEGLNTAFGAIEARSLEILVALRIAGPRNETSDRLATLIKRNRVFQWHEVIPLMNSLLANIVGLDHGDADAARMSEIAEQAAEWRHLADVLEEQSVVFRIQPGLPPRPETGV